MRHQIPENVTGGEPVTCKQISWSSSHSSYNKNIPEGNGDFELEAVVITDIRLP